MDIVVAVDDTEAATDAVGADAISLRHNNFYHTKYITSVFCRHRLDYTQQTVAVVVAHDTAATVVVVDAEDDTEAATGVAGTSAAVVEVTATTVRTSCDEPSGREARREALESKHVCCSMTSE